MCRVRGIGVAESVSTSTVVRKVLSHSLSSTPKRCSSSMIDQAEILEGDVFLEDAVSADQDVDLSRSRAFQTLADLGLGTEAVDDFDDERELGHAGGEAAVVLLGEDGGGDEDGDLLAGVDGAEGARMATSVLP